MALANAAAKNLDLDANYGAHKGANWPANLQLRLYVGDPLAGGNELTGAGGYAPAAFANDATIWADANAGAKVTSGVIQFPISTAAWSGTPDHFAITDTSGNLLDTGVFTQAAPVTAANVVVLIAAGDLQLGY